jgi:hypothetical protein
MHNIVSLIALLTITLLLTACVQRAVSSPSYAGVTIAPTATLIIHPSETVTPFLTPAIDLARFELDLPQELQFGTPAWSSSRRYAAVAIIGLVDGTKQTGIAIFDLDAEKAWWVHKYPSLDWGKAELQWSPDSNWIALLPSDATFADDCGLWIFSVDGKERHRFQAQIIHGWSEDSQRISFQVKDFCGYVDVADWEVYPCP